MSQLTVSPVGPTVNSTVDLEAFSQSAMKAGKIVASKAGLRGDDVRDVISLAWEFSRTCFGTGSPGSCACYALARVQCRQQFGRSAKSIDHYCFLEKQYQDRGRTAETRDTLLSGRSAEFTGAAYWENLVDREVDPAVNCQIRVDFAAWSRTLSKPMRRVLRGMIRNDATSETAQRLGVSSSRVSQMKGELFASWMEFIGE